MARVLFPDGFQKRFLNTFPQKLKITWPQLSKKLGVHPRVLCDWRREKYTLPERIFRKLAILGGSNIDIPKYRLLPDFWNIKRAARMGGIARMQKYGDLGTPEGRRKGGLVSQRHRRLYPERYPQCVLKKNIRKPRYCLELAEFLGIMLGDGGINSDYQIVITLHRKNDKEYADFVCRLIKSLFSIKPALYHYRSIQAQNVVGIVVSSRALVEFLLSKGLLRGSKVRHQIGVPQWIKQNLQFSKYCLRGLIDTDGGVYHHHHVCHGCKCFNLGLCFASKSLPLIRFAQRTLQKLNFNPKLSSNGYNVHLYQQSEVLRYNSEVRFHNVHHIRRIREFLKEKHERRGVRVV